MGLRSRRRRVLEDHEPAWDDELRFWADWLVTEGGRWPEDFARRMDPDALVDDPVIASCVERVPGDEARILDVGAGPLTRVGKRHETKTVRVTAVDPLATRYDRLLADVGLEPPVRTEPCTGEDLLGRFAPASFDIAVSSNAIDHAGDPVLCIANMLAAVRPGGWVVLMHFPHEGESQAYRGLHQWNLDLADGQLIMWSRATQRHDVTAPFAGLGHEVRCWWQNPYVYCTIRRAG